jgi:hypothetical protein
LHSVDEAATYCHVYGGTRDENNGFEIGWLYLLTIRLQDFLITINKAPWLIYSLSSPPLHTY